MHRLLAVLRPSRPDATARALVALAAVCVLVAGFQHARLFHRGYAEVEIVGLLFLMNAIGSTVAVLTLIFERVWMFVLGALSICVPSLVSIAISHSSGFLGFREGGYDGDALVIVDAEVAAVLLALAGAAKAAGGLRRAARSSRTKPAGVATRSPRPAPRAGSARAWTRSTTTATTSPRRSSRAPAAGAAAATTTEPRSAGDTASNRTRPILRTRSVARAAARSDHLEAAVARAEPSARSTRKEPRLC